MMRQAVVTYNLGGYTYEVKSNDLPSVFSLEIFLMVALRDIKEMIAEKKEVRS